MVSRPYLNKRGKLILGKGQKKLIRKQKGEGLSVLPIPLVRAGLSVFSQGEKKDKKMARINRIIMVKTDVPKKVTLPNGRAVLARYKRTTR